MGLWHPEVSGGTTLGLQVEPFWIFAFVGDRETDSRTGDSRGISPPSSGGSIWEGPVAPSHSSWEPSRAGGAAMGGTSGTWEPGCKRKNQGGVGRKRELSFYVVCWVSALDSSNAFQSLSPVPGTGLLLSAVPCRMGGVLLGGCRGTVVDSVVLCGQADALLSDLPSEAQIAKPAPQNLSEMHILPSQPGLTELEILGLEPPPPCPHPEQSLLQQSRQ